MMHSLYRLRTDELIVGYMKITAAKGALFSKDNFWWTGEPIFYTQKDAHCGLFDQNNRALYEYDIVTLRKGTHSDPKLMCHLLFNKNDDAFYFYDINSNEKYALFMNQLAIINKQELKFHGYSFDIDDDFEF